jgi:hypothetical protein
MLPVFFFRRDLTISYWTHVGPAPFFIPASLGALLPVQIIITRAVGNLTPCRTGTSAWRGDAYILQERNIPGSLTNWHASHANHIRCQIDFLLPEGGGPSILMPSMVPFPSLQNSLWNSQPTCIVISTGM